MDIHMKMFHNNKQHLVHRLTGAANLGKREFDRRKVLKPQTSVEKSEHEKFFFHTVRNENRLH